MVSPVEDMTGSAGVPLGGLGAGYAELGRDGYFRQLALNNNRSAESRIPIVPHSFLCVRVKSSGGTYTRILQQALPEQFPLAIGAPRRLAPSEFAWKGLYPRSVYRLQDAGCPLQIDWSAFAPIIPYDYDASTLPVLILSVEARNTGQESIEFSAVFNWENICGWTATERPDTPVAVHLQRLDFEEGTQTDASASGEEGEEQALPPNALRFGDGKKPVSNAGSEHFVVARRARDSHLSATVWDHEDAASWQEFWAVFQRDGDLDAFHSQGGTPRSGALCCGMTLRPGGMKRFDFVLAWYAPRFVVHGVDQGNGYCNKFDCAEGVARECLANLPYFDKSVRGWHRRLLDSSFPSWLSESLINSCQVLTSNGIYTVDGAFALMEAPGDPRTGRLDSRLYTTFGLLLLFPRFETSELALHMDYASKAFSGRLHSFLGISGVHEPEDYGLAPQSVDHVCHLVLSVLRSFCLSGALARLQSWFPILHDLMNAIVLQDRDGDGLPELDTPGVTYDGVVFQGLSSSSATLWLAALKGFMLLSEDLHKGAVSGRFQEVFRRARSSFERFYWNPTLKCYRLYYDSQGGASGDALEEEEVYAGQLTGEWYASLLGLGPLCDKERVRLALSRIQEDNERPSGLLGTSVKGPAPADGVESAARRGGGHFAWAGQACAYACLALYRGTADHGLRIAAKPQRLVRQMDLDFAPPDRWDLQTNRPGSSSLARPATCLTQWHLLYALQGFHLNIPAQILSVMPHLPAGVPSLSAPLFTPSCLGWLKFREKCTEGYSQRVQISFDSPVSIRVIKLRVPPGVEAPAVFLDLGGVELKATVTEENAGNDGILRLALLRPVTVGSMLTIVVSGKLVAG